MQKLILAHSHTEIAELGTLEAQRRSIYNTLCRRNESVYIVLYIPINVIDIHDSRTSDAERERILLLANGGAKNLPKVPMLSVHAYYIEECLVARQRVERGPE
jgi:hypothetical protein